MRKRFYKRWIYPFLSLAVILGLVVGSGQTAVASWLDLLFQGIQVVQLSNLSDRQEVALGQQINAQLTRTEVRLYRDRTLNEYVDAIGQHLAQESSRPPSEDFTYTFQVVNDNSVNAFATLGGFIYVNTGLLKAADNEAQLASVLAHELGHITERHVIKQMRQMAIARGLASAAGLNRSTIVNLGVQLAVRLPRSREAELDADTVGLKILGQAGYPQTAMIEFMEKLLNRPAPPAILSSHPATGDRIAAMERQIDPSFENNSEGLDETLYEDEVKSLLR